jgi:Pyruvate/2-oxoacid:ferredoxin oxidoreductase delta subunit
MQIIEKILHVVVSIMQTLMERFWIYEKRYLIRICNNAIKASPHSPPRAEEPFDTRIIDVVGDTRKIGNDKSFVNLQSLLDDGLLTIPIFLKIHRGIRRSYKSLRENRGLNKRVAGPDFYMELKKRARDYGIDLLGFTHVPDNYIFKDKCILYPNAIVCAQEMKRADMETAPELPASVETLRVYANLGQAMNRLAEFIRSQGIPCQVSHPLMGLVLYTALAAKAGLGYFGRQGLIITPEFGVRQRIGTILVPLEDMPWSDSEEHQWVLDFCDICNLCIKRCPGDAIYEEVKTNVPGVFTSTDNMKCTPYFSLWLGCSICVKVCPFSRKPYDRIKQAYERKEVAEVIEE